MITVWLAPAGPPCVVAYTVSKTLKLKISSRIETITSCGLSSGSVSRHSACQRLAHHLEALQPLERRQAHAAEQVVQEAVERVVHPLPDQRGGDERDRERE